MPNGAIGAGLTLANTLASWLLDDNGYHMWTREKKLEALHNASVQALQDRDYAAVDRLVAELIRLQQATT